MAHHRLHVISIRRADRPSKDGSAESHVYTPIGNQKQPADPAHCTPELPPGKSSIGDRNGDHRSQQLPNGDHADRESGTKRGFGRERHGPLTDSGQKPLPSNGPIHAESGVHATGYASHPHQDPAERSSLFGRHTIHCNGLQRLVGSRAASVLFGDYPELWFPTEWYPMLMTFPSGARTKKRR